MTYLRLECLTSLKPHDFLDQFELIKNSVELNAKHLGISNRINKCMSLCAFKERD
jgi:hypothetical protein